MPEQTPPAPADEQPTPVITTLDRTTDEDGDFTVTFTLRPRQN